MHPGRVVIIQARMSSVRLPGKVLATIDGHRSVLGLICVRFSAYREALGPVVVATSTQPEDDAVAREGTLYGCEVHRGPLDDVLARFTAIIKLRRPRTVVRATADNPLLAPSTAVRLCEALEAAGADHAFGAGLPRGVSAEAANAAALLRLEGDAPTRQEREHVTLGLRARPTFRAIQVEDPEWPADAPDIDLSVDTSDDLKRVRSIAMRAVARYGPHVTLPELARSLA